MKTKIICILVITLLTASVVLPVLGSMKAHRISVDKNHKYTTTEEIQNLLILLFLVMILDVMILQ